MLTEKQLAFISALDQHAFIAGACDVRRATIIKLSETTTPRRARSLSLSFWRRSTHIDDELIITLETMI